MPVYVNKFASPNYIEETIMDADGKKLGTLRIKPSSILWKPSGDHKFLSVPLDKFITWIKSTDAKAKLITS